MLSQSLLAPDLPSGGKRCECDGDASTSHYDAGPLCIRPFGDGPEEIGYRYKDSERPCRSGIFSRSVFGKPRRLMYSLTAKHILEGSHRRSAPGPSEVFYTMGKSIM